MDNRGKMDKSVTQGGRQTERLRPCGRHGNRGKGPKTQERLLAYWASKGKAKGKGQSFKGKK